MRAGILCRGLKAIVSFRMIEAAIAGRRMICWPL
jgi:hypothetical protein